MIGSTDSGNVFAAAMSWIEGVTLGPVAIALGIIAVAYLGFLLLSGRIELRRGAEIVLGLAIMFGASAIASGILRGLSAEPSAVTMMQVSDPPNYPTATTAPVTGGGPYDPYAGAALPQSH